MKKLATFGCVVFAFLPQNLSLFLRILDLPANESKTLRCPTNHYREGRWRCRPGKWGSRSAEWKILRKSVWYLTDVEVSSAKPEICDVKNLVSVNHLN